MSRREVQKEDKVAAALEIVDSVGPEHLFGIDAGKVRMDLRSDDEELAAYARGIVVAFAMLCDASRIIDGAMAGGDIHELAGEGGNA